MTEVNEVKISKGGRMADGEGGGGGKFKLIIILMVVLIIIGAGLYVVFKVLTDSEDEQPAAPDNSLRGTKTSQPYIAPDPRVSVNLENPQYMQLGTFVVNLADGRRYLKTNLEILLSEEKAKLFLEKRLSEVKDLVVAELQTLSTEQLRDPKERALLKQRLLRKVESLLPYKDLEWDDPKPLKKVLITEFYLQ